MRHHSLRSTFLAQTSVEITTSSTRVSKITGNGTWSEDNDNQKVLNCLIPSHGTVTECGLTDYHTKTLYVFAKDPDSGKVQNCTAHPLPANASTYRNQWAWVPDSKDIGFTAIDSCEGGETWEFSFEGKIYFKVAMDGSDAKPVATDYKVGTTLDLSKRSPALICSPPPLIRNYSSSCKPGLVIDL